MDLSQFKVENTSLAEEALKASDIATPEAPETPTDAPTEVVAPEVAEKQQSMSNLIAAAAKEKKRFLDAQRMYQQEKQSREQLEARIKELESKYAKPGSPEEALGRYGFSYDDLVSYKMNDNRPTADMEVKTVRSELEEFKKSFMQEKEAFQKQQQDNARQQAETITANFKSEIKDTVSGDLDKYELINLNLEPEEAADLIYSTIEQHYQKTKRVLQVAEAAELVEKHFEDRAGKLFTAKKLASKFNPQPTAKPAPTSSKTLSNSISSSASSMLPAKTENDRMARALAALDKFSK